MSKELIDKLLAGNERFISTKHEYIAEQKPFAAVVTCSDSRVPPEILFEQGAGDLFVVRNAGNFVSSTVIKSLDYAISHLDVKLVVVLGHEDCGAIKSMISNENDLHEAIIGNINLQVQKLKTTFDNEDINVLGAYYSLKTGKVDFL